MHFTSSGRGQEAISASHSFLPPAPTFPPSPSTTTSGLPPKRSHVTFLHICFLSFLSWKAGTNNETTLLLLIVETISKLPGAVYYISIVIFHPKISDSPTALSALGREHRAALTLSKALAASFAGAERDNPHLQSRGQQCLVSARPHEEQALLQPPSDSTLCLPWETAETGAD